MIRNRHNVWTVCAIVVACFVVALAVTAAFSSQWNKESVSSPVADGLTDEKETVAFDGVDTAVEANHSEVADEAIEEFPVGLAARREASFKDDESNSTDDSVDLDSTEEEKTQLDDSSLPEEGENWLLDYYKEQFPDWDPFATYDFDPDAGFSEKEISDIVSVLHIAMVYTGQGSTGFSKGYRTDSSQLEVAGPFPSYYLKADGTLDESPSEFCIVFDEGEPVFLIFKFNLGRTYYWDLDDVGANVHPLSTETSDWNGHARTTLLGRIEAGGTEFAFVSGNDETLLVDGDELYETEFVTQNREGLHPVYFTEYKGWEAVGDHSGYEDSFPSNGKPVDLTGLELGSLNNRQTFEYESPE